MSILGVLMLSAFAGMFIMGTLASIDVLMEGVNNSRVRADANIVYSQVRKLVSLGGICKASITYPGGGFIASNGVNVAIKIPKSGGGFEPYKSSSGDFTVTGVTQGALNTADVINYQKVTLKLKLANAGLITPISRTLEFFVKLESPTAIADCGWTSVQNQLTANPDDEAGQLAYCPPGSDYSACQGIPTICIRPQSRSRKCNFEASGIAGIPPPLDDTSSTCQFKPSWANEGDEDSAERFFFCAKGRTSSVMTEPGAGGTVLDCKVTGPKLVGGGMHSCKGTWVIDLGSFKYNCTGGIIYRKLTDSIQDQISPIAAPGCP